MYVHFGWCDDAGDFESAAAAAVVVDAAAAESTAAGLIHLWIKILIWVNFHFVGCKI